MKKVKREISNDELIQEGDIIQTFGLYSNQTNVVGEIISQECYGSSGGRYIEFMNDRGKYVYIKEHSDKAKIFRMVDIPECKHCGGRGGWMASDANSNVYFEDDTWVDCDVCNEGE